MAYYKQTKITNLELAFILLVPFGGIIWMAYYAMKYYMNKTARAPQNSGTI